jgi:hypothetical protein
MTEDTRLLDFYEGRGPDHRGRTLSDIQRFSLEQLEYEHDFIQWLFPLRAASPVNPEAPTLTDRDIARFRADGELAVKVRQSFEMMAGFYGFQMSERDGSAGIRPGAQFEQRAANWVSRGNHNFLRITRILKSLTILGQEDLARAFLDCLATVFADHHATIGDRTWSFWKAALVEN